MFGADTVVYLADSDSLVDGYILDERVVMPDDCQSWTLLNSTNNGGFLIFEAKRLLDTGDTQDRPIPQDGDLTTPPSRVIAAWSDLPSIQNHGPNNRASTILRFRASQEGFDFETAMASEAEGFIDIMANDHPIKPMDTEYAYFCVSLADMIAQGMPADTELHTIGFEPIIDPRAAKHVHHFILQASMDGNATTGSNCSAIDFIDMAYLWAPGEGMFNDDWKVVHYHICIGEISFLPLPLNRSASVARQHWIPVRRKRLQVLSVGGSLRQSLARD